MRTDWLKKNEKSFHFFSFLVVYFKHIYGIYARM